MATYDKLGVIAFGESLVTTGDLDPLYIALRDAQMPRETLCRWLLVYWCYYHVGLSCWAVSQDDFWATLLKIAKGGTKYPRSSERRHFRGDFAVRAVTKLAEQFDTAEDAIDWILEPGPGAKAIAKQVKRLYGFGEWISWKVPDMLERLEIGTVRFRETDLTWMFDSSLKGAKLVYKEYNLKGSHLYAAHRYLLKHLGSLDAPPDSRRKLNVQETETIFCKWKSHLNGHYPVGNDTEEIIKGLKRYNDSDLAKNFIRSMEQLQCK
jgi:hypothetical protein